MPDNAEKFVCEKCAFKCNKQSNFNKHLTTSKHRIRISRTDNNPVNANIEFGCECGKIYTARNSLWYHKRVCQYIAEEPSVEHYHQSQPSQPVDMAIVLELLKQNQDFKDLIIEQTKQNAILQEQLLEAVKDGKLGNNNYSNNTNTNCHNKFNLNFFLNETCKDAITMDDFVQSIEVSMKDFIRTGNLGFIDGISQVMVDRLQVMETHMRPLHCTDLKRETLYVKNADKWEKDTDKSHLRKAVKNVANKNYDQLKEWYHTTPDVNIEGTPDYENYFKFHKSALGDNTYEDKIIKKVLKEVIIEKGNSIE